MQTTEQIRLANNMVYHFDLWLVKEGKKDLLAADEKMKAYRKAGGEEYKQMERCINGALRQKERKETKS